MLREIIRPRSLRFLAPALLSVALSGGCKAKEEAASTAATQSVASSRPVIGAPEITSPIATAKVGSIEVSLSASKYSWGSGAEIDMSTPGIIATVKGSHNNVVGFGTTTTIPVQGKKFIEITVDKSGGNWTWGGKMFKLEVNDQSVIAVARTAADDKTYVTAGTGKYRFRIPAGVTQMDKLQLVIAAGSNQYLVIHSVNLVD